MKNFRSLYLFILFTASIILAPLRVTGTSPVAYLQSLPDSLAFVEMKKLINEFSNDSTSFITFHNEVLETFDDADSPHRNESLIIPLLQVAAQNQWLDEAARQRAAWRLKSALKNRPGSEFPNFIFSTSKGRVASVAQALHGHKTIILFYDPDCTHCMQASRLLKKLPLPSDWRVIALDITSPNDEAFTVPIDFPDNWIIGYPTEDLEEAGKFDFILSPTLFLTSPDGRIILKDTTVEKIASTLQK